MAKKFLSLTLLTALVLTTVIVHAEPENSIPKELIDGMQSDKSSSNVPVVNKKAVVKEPSLLNRSSDFFTRLEITAQQKDAQAASREGSARNAVNQITDLLLENSGNTASQWKAERILRSFSSEERVAIHAAVVLQLGKIADNVYDVNSQKRVAGGANTADAIAVGAHVLELDKIKKMVEAEKSFFVNGPSGKDYVYDQIWDNKVASLAVTGAVVVGVACYMFCSSAAEKRAMAEEALDAAREALKEASKTALGQFAPQSFLLEQTSVPGLLADGSKSFSSVISDSNPSSLISDSNPSSPTGLIAPVEVVD